MLRGGSVVFFLSQLFYVDHLQIIISQKDLASIDKKFVQIFLWMIISLTT